MPGPASDPLPLPESLTELVGARIASLPASSRAALGAAALLSRPTVALLDGILDAPDSTTCLAPAVSAGIMRFDDETIEFTHPLLAEAALASMTAAERTRDRTSSRAPRARGRSAGPPSGSRQPDPGRRHGADHRGRCPSRGRPAALQRRHRRCSAPPPNSRWMGNPNCGRRDSSMRHSWTGTSAMWRRCANDSQACPMTFRTACPVRAH